MAEKVASFLYDIFLSGFIAEGDLGGEECYNFLSFTSRVTSSLIMVNLYLIPKMK